MNLVRALGSVGGLTLASRVLALVRDTLQAAYIGASFASDAFFVAFRLPNMFRALFAEGAFAAAFITLFNQKVGEDVYEVVLKIDVKAQAGEGQTAFVVDLSYAGLFALRNIPQDHLDAFLLGEAPRILFPFARAVLANAVRDGGFPPLLLEPIDFGGIYLQQRAQQENEQGEPAGHA